MNNTINNKISFNGNIITKGKWTPVLKETFINNEEVKKLASGKHDIIGRMSKQKACAHDIYHDRGENLYKLTLEATSSVSDKIKSFLGLNKKSVKIMQNYHSEDSTSRIMTKRINSDTIAKKLNINL
ncbi:MAG: hypothetical protein E7Z89_04500 [Cyanobacteria bacterium SIG28]|nr:hypothetical protein [Cyanobacteria bacterium SIG28]